jgi:hypothetical protein
MDGFGMIKESGIRDLQREKQESREGLISLDGRLPGCVHPG